MNNKLIKTIKTFSLLCFFRYIGAIFPKSVAKIAFSIFTTPSRHYPRESDTVLLNQAVSIYEQFEGDTVVGYKFGNGANLVLLVHGWSSHALSMRQFIPELLNNGYSVLAFDAPGNGKSTGSHLEPVKYSRLLQYIYAKYNIFAVIAHSMGGTCSLFALKESKLERKIIKLVIIAAPIGAIVPIKQFIHYTKIHKKAATEFYNIIYKLVNNNHKMLSLVTAYPDGLDFSGLIIHDAKDSVVSCKNGEEINSILPNAKLLITHGLGHIDILKSPLVCAEIINYLSE